MNSAKMTIGVVVKADRPDSGRKYRHTDGIRRLWFLVSCLVLSGSAMADTDLTFHKDIQPIIQEKCVNCHRVGGAGPMPLTTFEEVSPFAGLIMYKTGLKDKMGAMPPYYMERDNGIQDYKSNPSLTEEQIAMIAEWVQNGSPRGNPADAPPQREFADGPVWRGGTPDIVVRSAAITMKAGQPDWWGVIPDIEIPVDEDRYISSVEVREINDVDRSKIATSVGGQFIVHHMQWAVQGFDEEGNPIEDQKVNMPIHELGRMPDIFDPKAGRLLPAHARAISNNTIHLHSNGVDTTAYVEIGFYLHPKGYEPEYDISRVSLGDGINMSIPGNTKDTELHSYAVLKKPTKITAFEPHLHSPGARMCLEAIWGANVETLSCVGYDHNWVINYTYADNAQPLLPAGTILHATAFMDNSQGNPNVSDPRNWQGAGNRSVTNMFIDLGIQLEMTDDQFFEEMANRREMLNLTKSDNVPGCPLCMMPIVNPLELTEEDKENMSPAEIRYWEVK
ncbi:MAG: hypothetical protein KDI28_05430 [Pseudomonadales bacterium]|nr:hypothetical protein [Pseudomonadales bacterium]MCP5358055.1 hypothetical protein [Pseudomonadales bacterium]